MRLCAAPLIKDRSGEPSTCFAGAFALYALSRAFSVRAACADLIAFDVFGREVTTGEDGFIGNGGGARSGSELSHLNFTLSIWPEILFYSTYMGTKALPQSDEAECWCVKRLSPSREASRSADGIVAE